MKMVLFCISLFIHAEPLAPVGLRTDEMTELGEREREDGKEEDESADVVLNEMEPNYNILLQISIM